MMNNASLSRERRIPVFFFLLLLTRLFLCIDFDQFCQLVILRPSFSSFSLLRQELPHVLRQIAVSESLALAVTAKVCAARACRDRCASGYLHGLLPLKSFQSSCACRMCQLGPLLQRTGQHLSLLTVQLPRAFTGRRSELVLHVSSFQLHTVVMQFQATRSGLATYFKTVSA